MPLDLNSAPIPIEEEVVLDPPDLNQVLATGGHPLQCSREKQDPLEDGHQDQVHGISLEASHEEQDRAAVPFDLNAAVEAEHDAEPLHLNPAALSFDLNQDAGYEQTYSGTREHEDWNC
ncbi:hypothetical protein ACP70R_009795 [Stipagrostis hirtigluma subsp. patula]